MVGNTMKAIKDKDGKILLVCGGPSSISVLSHSEAKRLGARLLTITNQQKPVKAKRKAKAVKPEDVFNMVIGCEMRPFVAIDDDSSTESARPLTEREIKRLGIRTP